MKIKTEQGKLRLNDFADLVNLAVLEIEGDDNYVLLNAKQLRKLSRHADEIAERLAPTTDDYSHETYGF